MPERNHEVIIDGFVFPDTVTVTLANDEYINSRDYVDKDLYESVSSANDYWQAENAKLRELAVLNWEWAHSCCGNNCKMHTDCCGYAIDRDCNYEREIADRMRELGVEVD